MSRLTHNSPDSILDWCSDADFFLSPTYARLLSWQKGPRIGRLVRTGYRRFCEARGLSLLEDAQCLDLLQMAEILGRKQVRDVLSAPRIAWRLLQQGFSSEEDGSNIAEAFIVEAALKGISIPVDHQIYSARCNYLLLPGQSPVKISRSISDTAVSLEIKKTSNPFGKNGNAAHSEEHSPEELDTAIAKIEESMAVLKTVVPDAYLFICDVMNILAVRKRNNTDIFETGTFSGFAGMVLFTNTHIAKTQQVMEGLVHEAVHCMLYMHESVEGGFLINRELEDNIFTSPWTGAHIRLQSFIHACFVWYTVYSLWHSCAKAGWDTKKSLERAAFAKRGFMHQPVTRTLEQCGSGLRPGILASLTDIENRMRNEQE